MPFPIDIPGLISAAFDSRGAAKVPISVSVFIDDTAPGDVVGHVRAAFASAQKNARVTIGYLGEGMPVPYESDDMAVIVAGVSEHIGQQAAFLREQGIPVMVVTTLPDLVRDGAKAFGYPIPEGDIIAPKVDNRSSDDANAQDLDEQDVDAQEGATEENADSKDAQPDESACDELIVLDDAAAASLDKRMGEWIIATRRDKKLTFALAFPFVRRPLALDSVSATSFQNAAISLVPFIPGADMPILTLNQAKMLFQIATAYGQPINLSRIKEVVVVVAGGFLFRNIARRLAGFIPVLGWAIRSGVGFIGTEAVGRAAIEYFEAGGDIVGLASIIQSARDAVSDTAVTVAHSPVGQRAGDLVKSTATNAFNAVLHKD